MTKYCHHNHNCLEELSADHKKILERLEELEKAIKKSKIDKTKVKEFLDFTESFAEPHHQKEEKVLFPTLEKKGVPKEDGPIGVMLFEHEIKRKYIKELEKALQENKDKKIKEKGQAISSLLRDHIFKEENILYPLAKDILTQEELLKLGSRCEKLKAIKK